VSRASPDYLEDPLHNPGGSSPSNPSWRKVNCGANGIAYQQLNGAGIFEIMDDETDRRQQDLPFLYALRQGHFTRSNLWTWRKCSSTGCQSKSRVRQKGAFNSR